MLRRFRLEIAWGVFATANVVAMFLFPEQVTIPFHLIWVSLTLLYGFRPWSPRPTVIVLAMVMVVTGAGELNHAFDVVELAEVPLMGAMFVAMVWHARRRQRALEELHAASERERDFLRDASHHLRTPVTIAIGHAELVRDHLSDPGALDDAEVVLDELHNLTRISDRILMLAAVDHPEYLRPERLAVAAVVERIGERWRAAAARRWQIDCEQGPAIEADAVQVERALDAIIENAVKYTEEDDAIRIAARREDGMVVIRVADTGSGIRPEELPYVFERFYGSGSGSRRGTGLGLAIARGVVQAHGGTVSIDSAPGSGTTVTVTLPAAVSAAAHPHA